MKKLLLFFVGISLCYLSSCHKQNDAPEKLPEILSIEKEYGINFIWADCLPENATNVISLEEFKDWESKIELIKAENAKTRGLGTPNATYTYVYVPALDIYCPLLEDLGPYHLGCFTFNRQPNNIVFNYDYLGMGIPKLVFTNVLPTIGSSSYFVPGFFPLAVADNAMDKLPIFEELETDFGTFYTEHALSGKALLAIVCLNHPDYDSNLPNYECLVFGGVEIYKQSYVWVPNYNGGYYSVQNYRIMYDIPPQLITIPKGTGNYPVVEQVVDYPFAVWFDVGRIDW